MKNYRECLHLILWLLKKFISLEVQWPLLILILELNGDCTQAEKPFRTFYARAKDMLCQMLYMQH